MSNNERARNKSQAREERAAQRRAVERRRSMDKAMATASSAPSQSLGGNGHLGRQDVQVGHRTAAALTTIGGGLSAVCAGMAMTVGTPVVGGGWSLWGLALGLGSILFGGLAMNAWRHANLSGRLLAVFAAAVVLSSFALGSLNPVIVDGHPVRSGSAADRSSRLSNELISDMLTLEDNGALLALPAEQGRGILGLYEQAAIQSSEIAAKWNPAVRSKAPLPGFTMVFSLVNQAADLQAQTLRAYAIQIQEPSATRATEIDRARSRIAELLAGPGGAVRQLSSTVEPIGIEIQTQEEQR